MSFFPRPGSHLPYAHMTQILFPLISLRVFASASASVQCKFLSPFYFAHPSCCRNQIKHTIRKERKTCEFKRQLKERGKEENTHQLPRVPGCTQAEIKDNCKRSSSNKVHRHKYTHGKGYSVDGWMEEEEEERERERVREATSMATLGDCTVDFGI